MTKYLFVTFSDGRTWRIPARVIADARAGYYSMGSEGSTHDERKETYAEEFALTMNDDALLMDWAKNDGNWEDWRDFAELDTDYDKEWVNAEAVIREA